MIISATAVTLIVLCFLVVRFVQPRAVYGVRHVLLLIRSRQLVLQFLVDGDVPGRSFAELLLQDYRHESADYESEIVMTRVMKVRDLYRLLDPERKDLPEGVRKPRASVCIVELADILKNVACEIEIVEEFRYPTVPADYFLAYIANKIRMSEELPEITDTEEIARWFRLNPISVEQVVEMLIALIVALDYRRGAQLLLAGNGRTSPPDTHVLRKRRRRRLVAEWGTAPQQQKTTAELLSEGESKHVEFKSTLRWNIERSNYDKVVTESVLRAVAALLNTEGGTVLVGVNDEGRLLGLEADRFASHDDMWLYFSNMFRDRIGAMFAPFLNLSVDVVDGLEIMRIECIASPTPVYAKLGRKQLFVVRGQAQTVELSMEEAHRFIQQRFAKS